MKNYKLHSSGANWWHFREKDSTMESWTVTIIHDGTVVLTGDYGVLAFRREYFPKDMEILKYFPGIDKKRKLETGIGYFAEKVCQACTIKDWDIDRAVTELKEFFSDKDRDISKEDRIKADNLLFGTEEEMYTELSREFPNLDMEDFYRIGEDYTKRFKFQFELLKYWTTYLKENLGGK